jgi:hypothetical protein
MANRAYLFPAERAELLDVDRQNDAVGYFDSRWCVPVAWWFLFEPGDVVVSSLQEMRMRADRQNAIDRFIRRRGALEELLCGRIDLKCIDFLVAFLSAWTWRWLVLDPSEILGLCRGDDAQQAAWFVRILQALSSSETPDLIKFEAESRDISPVDRAAGHSVEAQVIGFSYNEASRAIWNSTCSK